MHIHRRWLLSFGLAAALLLTGAATAQRRAVGRKAARDIPDSVLSKTLPLLGFKRRRAQPALLFNERVKTVEQGVTTHTSGVFVFTRGGWAVARFPRAADFEQTGWVFAGRAPDRPEVWAAAEIDVEGQGPALELVSSRDGGVTWRHYTLNKVSRFASFESLHMTRQGVGTLTVQLDEDGAQAEGSPSIKPGYYTYTTRDGGRTWSSTPRFSTAKPPEPPGALDRPDASYDDPEPPSPGRLRAIMSELSR